MLIPTHAGRPLLLLAAAALASCAGAERGGPEWLAADAEPVQLTIALESDKSASRTITEAGGTITATSEDGTRFRLRIPEGALLGNTVITMTPVASVKGLPLGGDGAFATVHLEPEGLQLMKPAVLSIRSKRVIPPEEQVAFAYFNHGDDAHLFPLGDDPSKVELSLLHFSGYGFGAAPRNDPGRQALQLATDREARLAARVADAINRERQRTDEGASDEFHGELLSVQIAWFDDVLRGLLREAETNDRMCVCAVRRYLGWVRNAMLLGTVDSESGKSADPELNKRLIEAEASAAKAQRNYYEKRRDRAMQKCRKHDFTFFADLVSLERQRQLLGISEETGDGLGDVRDLMQACMRFEVEFESKFDNQMIGNAGILYRVNARADFVSWRDEQGGLPVAGNAAPLVSTPIRYGEFRAWGNPMGEMAKKGITAMELLSGTISNAGTREGVFEVYDLSWNMNEVKRPGVSCDGADEEQDTRAAEDFTITFAPGVPKELVHYTSHSPLRKLGGESQWTDAQAGWADDWARWHRNEIVALPGRVLEEGVNGMVGAAFRIKLKPDEPGRWMAEYLRHDVNGHLFEKSTVVVRHTPR